MARLMMNWLQFEFGLIPSRIFAADKEEYIKALVETRESEDLTVFRHFMTQTMIRHMKNDIAAYEESLEDSIPSESAESTEKISTAEKIINLLKENPNHTTKTLAEAIGISVKGIEKQLSNLKAQGRIIRIGSARNGHWEIGE